MQKRGGKELLPFNNIMALIVIVFTINSAVASYLTYTHSKDTMLELSGELVSDAKARLCLNKQPSIYQNCSLNATIGVSYFCDVSADDPDNNTLTFYDNVTLFIIDPVTGDIIFTPVDSDAGTHYILVTVSDGQGCSNSDATTNFTITIPAAPSNVTPPTPGGGGGGGGGGVEVECTPQWECTPWGMCQPDGTRTRMCYTLNNCPVDKPIEESGCIYVLPPAPREYGYPQFQFCNFNEEQSCLRNVGLREDWLMTYDGQVYVLNFEKITGESLDMTMDFTRYFNIGMKRIKPVDVDGDGVEDVDFIYHSTADGRADVTGRLIRQVQSIRERPVYIQAFPWWITAILTFVYTNACIIILLLMILASFMIYTGLMDRVEGKREKDKEKNKK